MPRHTWVIGLYPYMEQLPIYDKYIHGQGFFLPPHIVQNDASGLLNVAHDGHDIAPAIGKGLWRGDNYWRIRGNYVVNFGNTAGRDCQRAEGHRSVSTLSSQWLMIKDGTSNTLPCRRCCWPQEDGWWDCRGDVHNDDDGSMFMTVNTPNAGSDFCIICSGPANTSNSRRPPPCTASVRRLSANPPPSNISRISARSSHPGGVNASGRTAVSSLCPTRLARLPGGPWACATGASRRRGGRSGRDAIPPGRPRGPGFDTLE